MALRIGPKYRGRFHETAKALVASGKRVGMMWLGGSEAGVHCHVCNSDFTPPVVDPIHKDVMGECPKCKTTFIFASAL